MVPTDERWAVLAPPVEACRPHAELPPPSLRRTVEAIVRRCRNGAGRRSVPAELGPWWMAARTFIRWARPGTWERLLEAAQACGVETAAGLRPSSRLEPLGPQTIGDGRGRVEVWRLWLG